MGQLSYPRVVSTGVNRHGNTWEVLDYGPSSPNRNTFRYVNQDGSTYTSKPDGWKEFDTGRGRVIEYAPDNWEESTSSPSPPSSPSQDINVKREPFENSVAAKQEPLEALLVKQEAVEMPLVKLEEEEGELPVRARSWSRCPLSNRLQRLQV
ncbi:hypothetical protein P389DRAFT_112942 [Cystobasidium minutum MCA 4210]|uniref:uncharacterized protein n=1 Tax=Cystobasidium minutum MCA 4210 TaxID=1397322 RepID=UPI0034CEF36C|eukprot:jgi/Rhomi1/112942/CE112941_785